MDIAILEDSSSLWSADLEGLEYDDSFPPCPWSTGVEEEWILEDSLCPWLAGLELMILSHVHGPQAWRKSGYWKILQGCGRQMQVGRSGMIRA